MRSCWAVIVVLAVAALAAAPATGPTSRPTASDLRTWFAGLDDVDADVRADSYSKLLGLRRADLEGLRPIVEQARPLSPGQSAALRDVVVHVYLTGHEYEPDAEGQGFLGVRPLHQTMDLLIGADEPDGGVAIGERLPGFCGFRALRTGDVILGTLGARPTKLRRWPELQHYVQQSRGGTVTFEVLRQGRVMNVAIQLDTRPAAAGDPRFQNVMEELLAERQALAEEYWLKFFAPLVEQDLS